MYEAMIDGEGYEIDSAEPFNFACCDCGLVHRVVIVSHDGKPVGLAVERDADATAERRAEITTNMNGGDNG